MPEVLEGRVSTSSEEMCKRVLIWGQKLFAFCSPVHTLLLSAQPQPPRFALPPKGRMENLWVQPFPSWGRARRPGLPPAPWPPSSTFPPPLFRLSRNQMWGRTPGTPGPEGQTYFSPGNGQRRAAGVEKCHDPGGHPRAPDGQNGRHHH